MKEKRFVAEFRGQRRVASIQLKTSNTRTAGASQRCTPSGRVSMTFYLIRLFNGGENLSRISQNISHSRVPFSLTPGFSPVGVEGADVSRFNGFP